MVATWFSPADSVIATVDTNHVWSRLVAARHEYRLAVPDAYDEVPFDVTARVAGSGSADKSDIGALLFWKRLRADTRWASNLLSLRDADVREVTARAVDAVRDHGVSPVEAALRGRRLLASLSGFTTGDAVASAVLVAAAPNRMAIYDGRAHHALKISGFPLTSARGRYSRYIAQIEQLRDIGRVHDMEWTAREVDPALFWLAEKRRAEAP